MITAADDTLPIGDTADVGLTDMIGYGFHHVLEGADHLLFRRREGAVPAARKVVRIVTAFTLGHSLTLIASALGWLSLPSTSVEVLIAISVAVSVYSPRGTTKPSCGRVSWSSTALAIRTPSTPTGPAAASR